MIGKKITTVLLAAALPFSCAPLYAQEGRRWNVTVQAGAGYMGHESGRYDKLARPFWYPTADLRIGHYLCSDDPSSYAYLYNFPNIGLGGNWKGSSSFITGTLPPGFRWGFIFTSTWAWLSRMASYTSASEEKLPFPSWSIRIWASAVRAIIFPGPPAWTLSWA